MNTCYSLGIGFTPDVKVSALSGDIPFVATPNELRALVKKGDKDSEGSEAAGVAGVAQPRNPGEFQGITIVVGDDEGDSQGFRKTAYHEFSGNFYTPDEEEVADDIRRTRRNAGKKSSANSYGLSDEDERRLKKSALSLLDSMSSAAGLRSSSDSKALLQARADFYSSDEKTPCLGLGDLFDREDALSVKMQKEICSTCPLIDKCLKMALLGDEQYGVWGGMDPKERKALKRKSMRMRRSNFLGGYSNV
jgi:hypothetical protein